MGYAEIPLRVPAISGYGPWIRLGVALLAAAVALPGCLPGRMLQQRVCETALAGELAAAG